MRWWSGSCVWRALRPQGHRADDHRFAESQIDDADLEQIPGAVGAEQHLKLVVLEAVVDRVAHVVVGDPVLAGRWQYPHLDNLPCLLQSGNKSCPSGRPGPTQAPLSDDGPPTSYTTLEGKD